MPSDAWTYAQQSVLGSMLIDERCVPLVMKETGEDDFQGANRTVYRAVRKLFLAGSGVDPVVVVNALGSDYRSFILELMAVTPTAANAQQYCRVCREESRAFRLRELAAQMQAAESLGEMTKLLEGAAGLMTDRPARRIVTMHEAMTSFMRRHSEEQPKYLQWPFQELNRYLFTEPGDFIVIGAKPSVGKTAFALQLAYHFSKTHKVGFFSLETTENKLFDRKMASVMEIDLGDLKQNRLQPEDWDRICARSAEVLEHDLELIRASGWTVADIRADTVIQGYKIIFVDYLQLIQGPGKDRASVVAQISMGLHTLAQSLGVTVIALSQLTTDDGKAGAPGLDSLRESRQIGNDADIVMMMALEDSSERRGPRKLWVEKNKEGALLEMTLSFDGPRQVFSMAQRTGEIARQLSADGKKARRVGRNAAQNPDQLTMLPANTPVPFQE